jgi:hypothetical protein
MFGGRKKGGVHKEKNLASSHRMVLWLCLSFLFSLVRSEHLIRSGIQWNDTNGNAIHAHGGHVIFQQNQYYWIGETDKAQSNKGINCYTSSDLYAWTFGSRMFDLSQVHVDNVTLTVLERPKLLWNEQVKKFVVLMHLDSSNYGFASVGIAVSSSCVDMNNPCTCKYQFEKAIRPEGYESRDIGIYVEKSDAYLLYASGHVNTDLTIAKLSGDYLDFETPEVSQIKGSFEAPTILKVPEQNAYYLFVSRTSGWSANEGRMFRAGSLNGPWTLVGNLSPSKDSYNSQPTFIMQHENPVASDKVRAIYLGDRWNYPDLAHASYVWLPIEISNTGAAIEFQESWNMDDYLQAVE